MVVFGKLLFSGTVCGNFCGKVVGVLDIYMCSRGIVVGVLLCLLCGLMPCSGWCLRRYVGNCGAMVGVWYSNVGYCCVLVDV